MSHIHISLHILLLAVHPFQLLHSSSNALDSSPVGWSCPPPEATPGLQQSSCTESLARQKFHTVPLDSGSRRRTSGNKMNHEGLIIVGQKYNLRSHTSITLPQYSSLQNMLASWCSAILLDSVPPGEHGAAHYLLDSDHQSSSSCITSSEPPL